MRPCVIFNPAAKGNKAWKFRAELNQLAVQAAFKPTATTGDARRLAAEAVRDGFDPVVTAGGDGTLNEVLNGIGDVPDGFERVRLGVIPLGTVNVFARELGIPLQPVRAWEILNCGQETRVDLPWLETVRKGKTERQYFAQLAGAGLDARAIELVDWNMKKKVGGLAYVLAGLRALREPKTRIRAEADGNRIEGELVLIGNGRRYGGEFQLFPEADMRDGLIDVCAFPRVTWLTLVRCSFPLLVSHRLPTGVVQRLQSNTIRLTAEGPVPAEVDGELAGVLPATLGVDPMRLRVVVP